MGVREFKSPFTCSGADVDHIFDVVGNGSKMQRPVQGEKPNMMLGV